MTTQQSLLYSRIGRRVSSQAFKGAPQSMGLPRRFEALVRSTIAFHLRAFLGVLLLLSSTFNGFFLFGSCSSLSWLENVSYPAVVTKHIPITVCNKRAMSGRNIFCLISYRGRKGASQHSRTASIVGKCTTVHFP